MNQFMGFKTKLMLPKCFPTEVQLTEYIFWKTWKNENMPVSKDHKQIIQQIFDQIKYLIHTIQLSPK